MKTFNEFQEQHISESGLSRIWQHIQEHDAGAISGHRADNSKQQNKRNNQEIKAYLIRKGYGVTSVDGSYIENYGSDTAKEVSESSFFVVDLEDTGRLKQDLRKLGEAYDQDSIMFVEKGGEKAVLIGTSKRPDAWPDYGQVEKVGSGRYGRASGQYFSRIRGRQFTFESEPQTRNGKWAMSVIAEKAEQKINMVNK